MSELKEVDRGFGSVRIILTSLVLLTLTLTITAPAAYPATSSVSSHVTLQDSSVVCHGSLTGAVTIVNDNSTAITVTVLHINVDDTALKTVIGSYDLQIQSPVIQAHTSENYGFTVSIGGGTTKYESEPADVVPVIEWTLNGVHDGASGTAAGFVITGCPKATPAFTQQSSSGSQQTSTGASGSSQPNSIPEFQLQPLAMVAFVLVIVGAYVLARRREVAAP